MDVPPYWSVKSVQAWAPPAWVALFQAGSVAAMSAVAAAASWQGAQLGQAGRSGGAAALVAFTL